MMVRKISIAALLAPALITAGFTAAPARKGAGQDLVEYGQYLSAQCATCHRLDAREGAIPPLGHLPKDYFIVAMEAYRSGRRNNPAMVSVVNALSREEVEALAAYYASLRQRQ